MKNILFIYTNYSSFVKTDFEILTSQFKVKKYQYKPVKGLKKNAIEFSKQFFFLLINIWKYDGVFIWFADFHSFLPVLFAKLSHRKSFVVIGGYDVARIKNLRYGVFFSKIRGFFALYSMKNCTLNLTVSKYVDHKVKWIAKNAKTELIYNCVTLNNDNKYEKIKKDDLIITVGIVEKEQTFYIKGIDTFIEVARQLPQFNFLIIGLNSKKLEHLLNNLPDNLTIKEKISHPELITYYQKAKIYCQLSRSESFGVALAEAMFFGCIPIVTNIGGLPEVVQGNGYIVKRNAKIISKLVKTIFEKKMSNLLSIQKKSLHMFTVSTRKKKIIENLKL